jgi:hypothetical protein
MKVIDFLLTIGALVSLLVATSLFSGDQVVTNAQTHNTVTTSPAKADDAVTPKTPKTQTKVIPIAATPVGNWKYIVIHHSATRNGNLKILDSYYHNAALEKLGTIYHFVIGNGTNSGDGAIESSKRWELQTPGPHCQNKLINDQSIAICLVGNFEQMKPTEKQMKALNTLVSQLQKTYNIPAENVKLHRDIDKTTTRCPGKNFPAPTLVK